MLIFGKQRFAGIVATLGEQTIEYHRQSANVVRMAHPFSLLRVFLRHTLRWHRNHAFPYFPRSGNFQSGRSLHCNSPLGFEHLSSWTALQPRSAFFPQSSSRLNRDRSQLGRFDSRNAVANIVQSQL
jgi:hypothetical protein